MTQLSTKNCNNTHCGIIRKQNLTSTSDDISDDGPWIPRADLPVLAADVPAALGGQCGCSPFSIDWMNPVAMLAVQSPDPHLK